MERSARPFSSVRDVAHDRSVKRRSRARGSGSRMKYGFTDPVESALTLAHDRRLERAVPVTRHVDRDRPDLGQAVFDRMPLREFFRFRPTDSCLS